jgi:hypothetical protein
MIDNWKNGAKRFPSLYQFVAYMEDYDYTPEKNTIGYYMKKHIEYMENEYLAAKRKKIQSCISCGNSAKFKTDETRPKYFCSKICYF